MGLESVTTPRDLNPLWPLTGDQAVDGDNHIRNLKTAVQWLDKLVSVQVFTASGTWTRPTGVKKVIVECLGGGGSGAAGVANTSTGGGGGSGGKAVLLLDVSAIASATVTIGVGGAGVSTGNGNTGAETYFNVTSCIGSAGLGGTINGGRGGPASGSTGTVKTPGLPGGSGFTFGPGAGGTGGGPGGGVAANQAIGGAADANSGGGGAGGGASASTGYASGMGGSGICVIYEYGS